MKRLLTSTAMIFALGTAAVAQTATDTETDGQVKKYSEEQAATPSADTGAAAEVESDTDVAADPSAAATDSETDMSVESDAGAATDDNSSMSADSGTAPATDGSMTDSAADGSLATAPVATDDAAPANMREGYAPIEQAAAGELTTDQLEGVTVYDSEDNNVGEIGSLVVSDSGEIKDVVIEVGGFLGIGEKPVAIPFEEVEFLKSIEGDDIRVFVKANEESLKAMPEYEAG